MNFKKIAVLTSRKSWFVPYAKKFVNTLKKKGLNPKLFFNHKQISGGYNIVFILSYFEIINKEFLSRHKHNLVVHESDLPQHRGWSPLFWQILENKNKIPIVLFEASDKADAGGIYLKDLIFYKGNELHGEIRRKQAEKTIELCLKFIKLHKKLNIKKQKGKATYCKKRTPLDSKLDINKSLKEQFNLLRIVNNEEFPAFFNYRCRKYIIKIYQDKNKNRQ
ncbi:MAG: formyltransferase family protein [Candidatus Omnitrophota bacterium]